MKPSAVTTVFFSATGNTRRGCRWLAECFEEPVEMDLTRFDMVPSRTEFGAGELVVLGAPVYGGRIYRGAAQRFRALRGDGTPCLLVVTYGNRTFDNALLELWDLAVEQGFRPVGAAALVAEHTYGDIQKGRPDEGDREKLSTFGRQAAEKLSREDFAPLSLPGERPYGEGGDGGRFHPLLDEQSCTRCGLCARGCPEGAIDTGSPLVDGEKCISCFRCIRSCPTGARNMQDPDYLAFAEAFTQRLAKRLEPEFFL